MLVEPALDIDSLGSTQIAYDTPEEVFSLHLGHPSPSRMPVELIHAATQAACSAYGPSLLQYCAEQGVTELREHIAQTFGTVYPQLDSSHIVITQGTSEALLLLAALYVDQKCLVLVETPSYPWAVRMFRLFRGDLCFLPTDSGGIRTDALQSVLQAQSSSFDRVLLYLMPNFQNPAGFCYAKSRRMQILEIAGQHDVLIVEDDAYCHLHYESNETPESFLLTSSLPEMSDRIVYLGTFSKLLGPGLRIGWIVCDPSTARIISKIKQTGSCPYLSYSILGLMQPQFSHALKQHLAESRSYYRGKRDALLEALNPAALASHGFSVSTPSGGFYLWISWPTGVLSSRAVCDTLSQNKVLVLDGSVCLPVGSAIQGIRLSFSYESADRLSSVGQFISDVLTGSAQAV